jgi:C1A family cysteine protease
MARPTLPPPFPFLALAAALFLAACEPGMFEERPYDDTASAQDAEAPVSDLAVLLEGAPENDALPELGKADAIYPEQFDLMSLQTPARNQGARGTCSIFAAVGLMEHLYVAAGWPGEPDFSEQYLQWSTKVQLGSFRNTDGSNASTNLRAIHLHGIPEEQYWPYERSAWGVSNDPECTGDDRPVRCYTNGEPPEMAADAEKYRLPSGRWVSSRSIKAHMTSQHTAVVAGMEFFYQGWNHRLSGLTTSDHYWREGYVTYPNDEDKVDSREKAAGHAILIVGWDDTLEVPMRDGRGDVVVDDEGNPKMERGFFIFKNSWGTGSFGVNNPYGDGFGYISMRYIEEFATVYTSDLPDFTPPVEICDDGVDNSGNGLVDCEDPACFGTVACEPEAPETDVHVFENTVPVAIPDHDPEGIASEIVVDDSGNIESLSVSVEITHTWRGDLYVTLVRDGHTVVLHDRTGGSADDLVETWTLTDFDGTDMAGTWRLEVADLARYDTGTLEGWALEITTAE